MKAGGALLIGCATLAALPGCSGSAGLAIRLKSNGLAIGDQPASFRVAEARSQFALGNVALALEGFRKAFREDPNSVDAMNGLAVCYDRMGRFDLSRAFYESALAVAPDDPRLYANLALSLELQGRDDDATAVRNELASRLSRSKVESAAGIGSKGGQPAEQITAVGETLARDGELEVTQVSNRPSSLGPTELKVHLSKALEPPKLHAPSAAPRPAANPIAREKLATSDASRTAGPYLQRLSLGEVRLVSANATIWKPRKVERLRGSVHEKSSPAPSPVIRLTLLNAARSQGLAARIRGLLQRRGFGVGRTTIGDAPHVRDSSVVFYPAGRRVEALRISQQFGFTLHHRARHDVRSVTVLLGRDAAEALNRRSKA